MYMLIFFVCVCVVCVREGTLLSHYPEFAPAVSPREFALIGAAAFSTGVTRAVSTTVIVYELSGHKHIHLPLSGATYIISLSLCNV
jgi:H+/Cl- antiporter ClcA